MIPSIVICAVTCLAMIAGVLFFPAIRLGRRKIATYWVVALVGAAALLLSGQADVSAVWNALIAPTAVNPIKILVLFLSMTILSIFLDELGFFRLLASLALRRAGAGQGRLFLSLYVTVSILTVFTSNDVIILSFTPFICYFAKNAEIDPLPYLAAEFVAANTWSMALVIGNPTNIYLASAYGMDFLAYLKMSALPTLFAGLVSLAALYLLFRKRLKTPVSGEAEKVVIADKPLLWVGIVHLAGCTVLLALSSALGFGEMWMISLGAVVSLALFAGGFAIARRKRPAAFLGSLKRAPYPLVPFVLSMFVLITGLGQSGATAALGGLLGSQADILTYGLSSFFTANLINNIPMSVLFSSVIEAAGRGAPAMLATVIGSNLGAVFTPIGALAGIMWTSIVGEHGVKFGYAQFLKMGVAVALPSLLAALGGLALAVAFF